MSRSLSLILAVIISLAGSNLAYSQDAQPATAPAGDGVANLKAENAKLKKEVSDAAKTISDLQAKLTQTNAELDTANASLAAAKAQPATAPVTASDGTTSGAAPAAPAEPPKALPLDATNVVTTPGAPGDTGAASVPGKTYTVVKGDSLWKIAHKMYPGDTKNGVDKIQEANKDAIGGKPLKIGQVLVIPQ